MRMGRRARRDGGAYCYPERVGRELRGVVEHSRLSGHQPSLRRDGRRGSVGHRPLFRAHAPGRPVWGDNGDELVTSEPPGISCPPDCQSDLRTRLPYRVRDCRRSRRRSGQPIAESGRETLGRALSAARPVPGGEGGPRKTVRRLVVRLRSSGPTRVPQRCSSAGLVTRTSVVLRARANALRHRLPPGSGARRVRLVLRLADPKGGVRALSYRTTVRT
jgi:hypothetical protein